MQICLHDGHFGMGNYIILDETHHSSDENVTYSEVLNHFKPKFLLGLSATPERADDFDILSVVSFVFFDGLIFLEFFL